MGAGNRSQLKERDEAHDAYGAVAHARATRSSLVLLDHRTKESCYHLLSVSTAASVITRSVGSAWLIPCLATVFFWLAFDEGTYSLESRGLVAIAVWWAVILLVPLGACRLRDVPKEALAAAAALGALATLTLASAAWGSSAERAFNEFNRVSLYLGVFLLVVIATRRSTLARWLDGLTVALGAVALVALVSRLFPDFIGNDTLGQLLPSAQTRLSYPIGYWNGLAILLGLGTPLFLRVGISARSRWVGGLAVGAVPISAAAIYLTSSRGGVAAAAVALVCFLALTGERVLAFAAAAAASAGAAVSVAVLAPRSELVNGPLGESAAQAQGRTAALYIGLVCVGTGIVFALGSRFARKRQIGRRTTWLVGGAVLVLFTLTLALADPVQLFETFKKPPSGSGAANGDFVKSHLLSGNGSGRWQFWEAAVDEFSAHPFSGGGAGSYEAWWAQHGSISYFVRDAHSLYLEELGELGIAGLALVLVVVGSGLLAATKRVGRRDKREERVAVAAIAAAFAGYAVGAGIDWMWELTVVSVVGMTLLALLTGPATAVTSEPHPPDRTKSSSSRRLRRALVGAAALAGFALIVTQALPVLVDIKLNESETAVSAGDGDRAAAAAAAARDLQPWATTPYLQLALVYEQRGELPAADAAIGEAIERDSEDWRLWLIAARIEAKLGETESARQSLAHAAALNPRSPLFSGLS